MAEYHASADLKKVGDGYPYAKFYFSHQFPGDDLPTYCLFSVSCLNKDTIVEQFGIEFNDVRRGVLHEREAFTRAINVDAIRIDRIRIIYRRPDGTNVLVLEEEPMQIFEMPWHSKSCFVATACFQDADHPIVSKLRAWRDERLSRRLIGRQVIAVYNWIGPYAAKWVERIPGARPLMQRALTRFANYIIPEK